jgi:hypothetical protein
MIAVRKVISSGGEPQASACVIFAASVERRNDYAPVYLRAPFLRQSLNDSDMIPWADPVHSDQPQPHLSECEMELTRNRN